MKLFAILSMLILVSSCTKKHDLVYVFEDQAYSSTSTSDFAFVHFKIMANTNVLIIKDVDTKYDKVRELELSNLCVNYEMNCKIVDMTEFNLKSVTEAIEEYKAFDGEKFLLVAASNSLRAKFIGSVHLIDKSKSSQSLQAIFDDLLVSQADKIKITNEILKIKDQYFGL